MGIPTIERLHCMGGVIRSSDEVTVMVMERRDDIITLEIREQLGKT